VRDFFTIVTSKNGEQQELFLCFAVSLTEAFILAIENGTKEVQRIETVPTSGENVLILFDSSEKEVLLSLYCFGVVLERMDSRESFIFRVKEETKKHHEVVWEELA